MGWPNSIANRAPALQGLPAPAAPGFQVPVPANDNPPFRIPRPANDNVRAPRPQQLIPPRVRLPIPPWAGLAVGVATAVYYYMTVESPGNMGNWTLYGECPISPGPTGFLWSTIGPGRPSFNQFTNRANACLGGQAANPEPWEDTAMVPAGARRLTGLEYEGLSPSGTPRYRVVSNYGRDAGLPAEPLPVPPGAPVAKPLAVPPVAPGLSPDFFPDAMPVGVPVILPLHPPLRGPGPRPGGGFSVEPPGPPGPPSRPPKKPRPPRKPQKERKLKMTRLEMLVSMATDAMDIIQVMFDQLPTWKKFQTMHQNGGRHTPYSMAQAVWNNFEDIDASQAFYDLMQMNQTDKVWALLGQSPLRGPGAPGGFTGPWDTEGGELSQDWLDEQGIDTPALFEPYFEDGVLSDLASVVYEVHPNGEIR